ncbi:hypothetical protein FC82_GL001473 [Secundilactobacillus collinoides DSM 20515 = JCM 1123]|uniref:Uncharacterized protein n=2 Tax=Secundilactobacillus collinoides TaxID=33960 RepID=A0A0R2B123_SECCO|nr:hypothetical protein FC82_GL001473 [Secundilactobacillus collinoides DSM 20515 = JCM 1123]
MYVIFVVICIIFKLLRPADIGWSWSVFWYIAAAGIAYYFYFKNVAYQEVVYYAKKLQMNRSDLEAIVPNRKNTAEVPDPDHPNIFSPIVQVPLAILNRLSDELIKQAKEQEIPPFK